MYTGGSPTIISELIEVSSLIQVQNSCTIATCMHHIADLYVAINSACTYSCVFHVVTVDYDQDMCGCSYMHACMAMGYLHYSHLSVYYISSIIAFKQSNNSPQAVLIHG